MDVRAAEAEDGNWVEAKVASELRLGRDTQGAGEAGESVRRTWTDEKSTFVAFASDSENPPGRSYEEISVTAVSV